MKCLLIIDNPFRNAAFLQLETSECERSRNMVVCLWFIC